MVFKAASKERHDSWWWGVTAACASALYVLFWVFQGYDPTDEGANLTRGLLLYEGMPQQDFFILTHLVSGGWSILTYNLGLLGARLGAVALAGLVAFIAWATVRLEFSAKDAAITVVLTALAAFYKYLFNLSYDTFPILLFLGGVSALLYSQFYARGATATVAFSFAAGLCLVSSGFARFPMFLGLPIVFLPLVVTKLYGVAGEEHLRRAGWGLLGVVTALALSVLVLHWSGHLNAYFDHLAYFLTQVPAEQSHSTASLLDRTISSTIKSLTVTLWFLPALVALLVNGSVGKGSWFQIVLALAGCTILYGFGLTPQAIIAFSFLLAVLALQSQNPFKLTLLIACVLVLAPILGKKSVLILAAGLATCLAAGQFRLILGILATIGLAVLTGWLVSNDHSLEASVYLASLGAAPLLQRRGLDWLWSLLPAALTFCLGFYKFWHLIGGLGLLLVPCGCIAAALVRDTPEKRARLTSLLLAGALLMVFSFLGSNGVWAKANQGLWLLFPAGFLLLRNSLADHAGERTWRGRLARSGGVLSLGLLLAFSLQGVDYRFHNIYHDYPDRKLLVHPISDPRLVGIFTSEHRARALNGLLRNLRPLIQDGDYLLVYGNMPTLHFVTNTLPPLGDPWPVTYWPKLLSQRLQVLEQTQELPKVAVRIKGDPRLPDWGNRDGGPPPEHLYKHQWNIIDRWVQEHGYSVFWSSPGADILIRPST